jgi:hypothetical protein
MMSISKLNRHGDEMTECIGVCNAISQCVAKRKAKSMNDGVIVIVIVRSLEAVQGALLLALLLGVVKGSHAGLEVCTLSLNA